MCGSSEVYRMECSNIHGNSPAEPGWISLRTRKNKRHSRRFRILSLSPIAEQLLSNWFHHHGKTVSPTTPSKPNPAFSPA